MSPDTVLSFQFHNGTIKTAVQSPQQGTAPLVFQFHNGTIKTNAYCWFIAAISCFNSITVQLRQLMEQQHQYNKECFNSITVQLRRNPVAVLHLLPLFQFHNGTIKT